MNNPNPNPRVPPAPEVFKDEGQRKAAALAESGDIAGLSALASTVDLNAEAPLGVNLLMFEIAAQNEVAVRALLEAGANPNHLTKQGASPMLIAGASEDSRWLGLLLDKGGDPNLRDQRDNPLLPVLVPYGRWDNVLLLLDRGAKIDDVNHLGQTALMLYGALHQFDKVHALLERGASAAIKDSSGISLQSFVSQRLAPKSDQGEWQKRVAERIGAPLPEAQSK